MAKDKSLMKKFADTVRDVAKTATEAASAALQPPAASKADQRAAAYVPLAADGLVADPMMAAPMVQPRPRGKNRAAPKRAAKTTKKPAKKSAARTSSRAASRKTARKTKTAAKRRRR
jgi:hypothetical protein